MYDLSNDYRFSKDRCWFKDICEDYSQPGLCDCACPVYYQFYYLVNLANIPLDLQYVNNNQLLVPGTKTGTNKDEKEHQFLREIQKDIYSWVKEGNNLYLFSEHCGNGKTTWATKLMLSYFYQIYENNGTQCRGLYINTIEYFIAKKNSLSTKDSRLIDIEQLIPTVDLVIWDDIGNMQLTPYEYTLLYSYINQRINNGKANIFTSNVIDGELNQNIGERLSDRILSTSEIVEFINPSFRKPKRQGGRK